MLFNELVEESYRKSPEFRAELERKAVQQIKNRADAKKKALEDAALEAERNAELEARRKAILQQKKKERIPIIKHFSDEPEPIKPVKPIAKPSPKIDIEKVKQALEKIEERPKKIKERPIPTMSRKEAREAEKKAKLAAWDERLIKLGLKRHVSENYSYSEFYEAFSFNPFNKGKQRRETAVNDAVSAKRELKQFLDSKGYRIIKSSNGAFHVRSEKLIGFDPNEKEDFDYKKDPILSIPEMRELFTLAHEVGHALEWTEDDLKVRYPEFRDAVNDAPPGENFDQKAYLRHVQKLWYELNAWVEGMQFIPVQYKKQYKNYAYHSYKTYMTTVPKYYNSDILLRNLLYKLNFEEQK